MSAATKKPKKCRHTWRETKRQGNFWAGVLTVMEQCTKCNDVRLRPATDNEIELAQSCYTCPICQENHRPTNPLYEGCIATLVKRVRELEEAHANHVHSSDDGMVSGLP